MPRQTKDGENTPNNAMGLLIGHIFCFFPAVQDLAFRKTQGEGICLGPAHKTLLRLADFQCTEPHTCYYDLTCFISMLWVSTLLFS